MRTKEGKLRRSVTLPWSNYSRSPRLLLNLKASPNSWQNVLRIAYTFIYSINGEAQTPITTSINPYIIKTKTAGNYTLISYVDANEMGVTSGEAYVTTLTPPTADFIANPDTMSIIYTSSQAVDKSTGNIISWMWDFGDNSAYSIQNPYHTYKDSIAIYQITLIGRRDA